MKTINEFTKKWLPAVAYMPIAKEEMESDIKSIITEHEEGKMWLPYPQNKPLKQGWYLVTMGVDQKFTTVTDAYWMGNSWNRSHIIAFRKLPQPYKEGDKT
jgi:hypothetical protein